MERYTKRNINTKPNLLSTCIENDRSASNVTNCQSKVDGSNQEILKNSSSELVELYKWLQTRELQTQSEVRLDAPSWKSSKSKLNIDEITQPPESRTRNPKIMCVLESKSGLQMSNKLHQSQERCKQFRYANNELIANLAERSIDEKYRIALPKKATENPIHELSSISKSKASLHSNKQRFSPHLNENDLEQVKELNKQKKINFSYMLINENRKRTDKAFINLVTTCRAKFSKGF